MKRNKLFITILYMFLLPVITYSQDYYWYRSEKIYLPVDSTKLNVTTAINTDLLMLLNEFNSISEVKLLEKTQNNTLLFSVKLSSSKSYNNVVDYLKSIKDVVCVSKYYGDNANSIGTSSFFCIKLHKENDYELLSKFALKSKLKIIEQVPYMPTWYILSTTNSKNNSTEISNVAYESGLFDNIDPLFMFKVSRQCPPNDPDFDKQWGLSNTTSIGIDINVCDAWTISTGAGIKVAVLDVGIDRNHIDLNIDPLSYDVYSGGGSIFVPGALNRYHGTLVAGIIAAKRNNNIQVAGVAPDAKLVSISDTSAGNSASAPTKAASGISWAWKVANVDIINNSWVFSPAYYSWIKNPILESAIDSALRFGRGGKGCVVVFASGNRSDNKVYYPGDCNDDIIVVGGIRKTGERWDNFTSTVPGYGDGSNYGTYLDIVAPCDSIYTTYPNNISNYSWGTGGLLVGAGTSWAAPHVSGVAALVLAKNSSLTQQQVKKIIELTATKLPSYTYNYNDHTRPNGGWNNQVGYGLVNAYEAVKAASCSTTTLTGIQTTQKIICKNITIQNATIPSGVTLELIATENIIIGSGVIVKSGGTLELEAVNSIVDYGTFTVESGASFIVKNKN